jgi:hypothetical protein
VTVVEEKPKILMKKLIEIFFLLVTVAIVLKLNTLLVAGGLL